MLSALNAGVSGIQQFQTKLNVVGNNIANSNTVGYKGARAEFEDSFSQALSNGTTGVQVGSGVNTSTVRSVFTQGLITRSESPEDLAISGDGFFVVKDANSSESFATRAGQFRLDSTGYLVTTSGLRVQGYNDAGLSSMGDLRIDPSVRPEGIQPNAEYNSYSIDTDGTIYMHYDGGVKFPRGQVLLQSFRDPAALTKEGNNLYSNFSSAGPLGGTTPTAGAPGTQGLGRIQSASLEMSNVDLTTEFSTLITTQRGFQANARMITTADELLQEVVNLKR